MTSMNLSGAGTQFVHNAWYAAAYSDELVAGKPLGCVLLGEPVVLYRRADGAPAALEDRCVHRSLPLSMGRVRGDVLECGYHGLQYDCEGTCVRIPGQSTIPARRGCEAIRWSSSMASSGSGWAMRPAPTRPRSRNFRG